MTMDNIELFLIVCVSMFLVGVIDSVAGGGGLISLPVFLMAGLPPRTAFGTNKVMAFTGSSIASYRYYKQGYFDLTSALTLTISIIAGELAGTGIIYIIPERAIEGFLSVMLPAVALFTVFSKKTFNYSLRKIDSGSGREKRLLLVLGLVIGLYAGTIGAAGATIGMMLLCGFVHYDVRTANGTLKFAMAAGCVSGLVFYIINGDVNWSLAVPSVVCNMAGNYFGSGLAAEKGAKIVRPAALIVVCVYAVKTLISFI